MNRSTVARASALVLSVGVLGALVFQACSSSGPPPPEPMAQPEPARAPAVETATPAAAEGQSQAVVIPPPGSVAQPFPPPDYMGASKAAPVFHPHPSQPPPQPAQQQAAPKPGNEGAPKKNAIP